MEITEARLLTAKSDKPMGKPVDRREFCNLGPYYADNAWTPQLLLEHAEIHLTPHLHKFDTIACSGVSGVAAAPLLAYRYRKHLCIVRHAKDDKGSSGSHSPVCGHLGRAWIFVDDLVSMGETRARVKHEIERIAQHYHWPTRFRGTYLYCSDEAGYAWADANNTPD